MKITIFSEKENPFMMRKEVLASIEHTAGATPSRASLQQMLAAELKAKPEQIDVKSIHSYVGKQASRLKVHVWHEAKMPDLSKQPKEGQESKASKGSEATAASAANAAAPAPAGKK